MGNVMKKLISIITVVIMLSTVLLTNVMAAEGAWGDELRWHYSDGTLTISGNGKMQDTKLLKPWNKMTKNIQHVVIEEGVTVLYQNSFSELLNLKSITIPVSVTKIFTKDLFSTARKKITVYYKGSNADWDYIKIDNPDAYKGVLDVKFDKPSVDLSRNGKCGKTATWTLSDDGTFTITGSGYLDSGDFVSPLKPELLTKIRKVVIGEGITFVGNRFLEGCTTLESVEFPQSLTSIGEYSFYNCTNLKSVTIKSQIEVVGIFAFYGCSNLKDVYYFAGKDSWDKMLIHQNNEELVMNSNIHYNGSVGNANGNGIYIDPGVITQGISLFVNNSYLPVDQAPFEINGRTLVPLRAVTEALDCEVTWNEATQTAQIQNSLFIVAVQIGNYKLSKVTRGSQRLVQNIELDVPPVLYNGRTMVPIRAIAEAFDAVVSWDAPTKIVNVNRKYDFLGSFYRPKHEYAYSKDVAVVGANGYYGVITEDSQVIIPVDCADIQLYSGADSVAIMARRGNKLGFYLYNNYTLHEIFPIEYDTLECTNWDTWGQVYATKNGVSFTATKKGVYEWVVE